MKHEGFSVRGFEFMDEPATDIQKNLIVELGEEVGTPMERNGVWPDPFTKWDAWQMIDALKERRKE